MPYTLHVVSHTHWDREWYLPFQRFRLRLVDLVDHLLDILDSDPTFRHFNLDAQTIVLEDYLAVRPHARERLQRHIRDGRITVGPWYQLNDEFLVSGESTVRSLLVGTRMAAAFDGGMKVGYLPDQFGNVSQMPQILRGFGIDNAIMGRGYQLVDDRKVEFVWQAPDGSRVLGSLMAWWYNNAQYIPQDPAAAAEWVVRTRDVMAARSRSHHLLLMNGVDHLEAQPYIGRLIEEVNAELERRGVEDRLVHSTLPAYVEALRTEVGADLPQVAHGELREDRGGACLAGTLSSRMILKQANHRAQVTLEKVAERLASFARIDGAPYPFDTLHYAWKLLMQNHPHDSICGCSVDQVHYEMMPRFDQVVQVGEEMADRALDALTGRDRTRGVRARDDRLLVLNTLNWTRTDPVVTTLEFPLGEMARGNPTRDETLLVRGFRLLDPQGREVPFAVTRTETAIATVANPHELPLDQWVQRYTVEFVAEGVPACGWKEYRIEPLPAMPQYPRQTEAPLVSPHTVTFEDGGDVGDEYLYRSPLNDGLFRIRLGQLEASEEVNAVRRTLVFSGTWDLPVSASGDGQSRSDERAPCRITTRMTRWAGGDRVEFETELDNQARDHRLRVRFDQGGAWDVRPFSYAEGQYDVVERPTEHPLQPEGASPFHPQQMWTSLVGVLAWEEEDGRSEEQEQTLTIINEGLPEYEVYHRPDVTSLAVTLLRCVGQLSGRGDGPGISTPDAQCPGRHVFRYAHLVSPGCWKSTPVWQQAHQFNVPLRAVQCPAVEARAAERSFLSVAPAQLVVSAVKRAEDRDSLIVRLYNTTDDPVPVGLVAMPGARRYRLVNLNEEPQEEWRDGDSLRVAVHPKQIVTVEFEV